MKDKKTKIDDIQIIVGNSDKQKIYYQDKQEWLREKQRELELFHMKQDLENYKKRNGKKL